jgi:hypothetical protein
MSKVVFHWGDAHRMTGKDVPPYHKPNQIWTYRWMEFSQNTSICSHFFDGKFNATATYRHDSDIVIPYGVTKLWDQSDSKPDNYIDYSAGKTEMAAWFVSNCHPFSKRELYAKELQKHVSVHIYGNCGTYRCERSFEKSCYAKLNALYHFYLSFESSLS